MTDASEPVVKLDDSEEGFEYWANRDFLSMETKTLVMSSQILLVPDEEFRDGTTLTFPTGTEGFFEFVREELGTDHPVEIAIEDNDYKELALHGATLIIAGSLVTLVAAPVLVHVINKFIDQKFFKDPKKDENNVRVEVTVEERVGDKVRIRKLSYDGPAEKFKVNMQQTLSQEFPKLTDRSNGK